MRILMIGNSFSDDTAEYLYQIAVDAGVKAPEIGNLYIPGCPVSLHALNAREDRPAYEYRENTDGHWVNTPGYKLSTALTGRQWDFISLQQASGLSGLGETFGELDYLIDYVRSLAGSAPELVWNMTWAYSRGVPHPDFPRYGNDQGRMYGCILETVKTQIDTRPGISIVCPAGTAIQNVRTSFVGDNITRDGYHLSFGLGRYTAGLTFFGAVAGRPADNVRFAPEGVDEPQKRIALEAAADALRNPRTVTPICGV